MQISCTTDKLLKRAGVEENLNRTMVLDILTTATHALSPKEILDRLRKDTAFDKVTLYRILDLLASKKIVRRIAGLNGAMAYEIICQQHHPIHAHFLCRGCGQIECLNDISINNLIKKIRSTRPAEDEDVDLRFEGVCEICRQKEE